MRKTLTVIAALAIMPVATASAADMALKAPPVPYVGYNWTGFYVGADGGGGWASSQSTVLTQPNSHSGFPPGFVANPINLDGPLGGFYGGANYQIQQFVLGIDGDYTWTDLTGSGQDVSPVPGNGAIAYHNDKMDWLATVTGRVGFADNNWLFYGKGGWASGGFKSSNQTTSATGTLSSTSSGTSDGDGWTLGTGVEWGLAQHWSAKLEYDYVKFDTSTVTLTETNASTGAVGYPTRSVTSYVNVLKVGLAYRF